MYKHTKLNYVIKNPDSPEREFIPFDPDNTDYQAYLAWLALGNVPHSADGTTNLTPLNREAE